MVDGLVETSLLIDILRGYALADQWLEQQTETLGITRFVWLEVLQGAENRANYQRSIALLKAFELIDVTPTDIEWATEQMLKLTLRYHTEAMDFLIAAPSYRLQIPLYTRNLKHFTPLIGELARQPY